MIILTCLLWALIVFLLLSVSGCSVLGGSTPDPMPELTPGQSITKAIEHTNWLVTLAVIGAGAGFFAFLNGNGVGLKLIAACLVIISLTLMISWAAKWIAVVGIVGSVGLLIYTIWTKNKAIKEVVRGNELFMGEQGRMYGSSMITCQKSAQSPSTKKIVDDTIKKIRK